MKTEVLATDATGFPTVARQRVTDTFSRWLDDGVCTAVEANAARWLRRLWDQQYIDTTVTYRERLSGQGGSTEDVMLQKLKNAKYLSDALNYLTPTIKKVVHAAILESDNDLSPKFTAIGRFYHPYKKSEEQRIAGRTLVGLACRELAAFLAARNIDAEK